MRKRFQFSIRAILLATFIATLPLAWLASQRQAYLRRFARLTAFNDLGGRVDIHYADAGEPVTGDGAVDSPAWYFIALHLRGSKITDEQLALIEPLKTLKVLDLRDTAVTDAGLVRLRGLTMLEELNLEGTRTSRAGINDLRQRLPYCKIAN